MEFSKTTKELAEILEGKTMSLTELNKTMISSGYEDLFKEGYHGYNYYKYNDIEDGVVYDADDDGRRQVAIALSGELDSLKILKVETWFPSRKEWKQMC